MMLCEALESQARGCARLGSPFMERLLNLFAARLDDQTQVGRRMHGWGGDITATGHAIGLRLAGTLHRMALSEPQGPLARVFSKGHGDLEDDALWDILRTALETREDEILEGLASPPQTNEIRRCSALAPGFLAVVKRFGLPLRLSELGASAGLNLLWDLYSYELDGVVMGRENSPVHLTPDWRGALPDTAKAQVIERQGCDLNPLDIERTEDQLRLKSYAWADQPDRLARLDAAFEIVRKTSFQLDKANAVDWLENRLRDRRSGTCHVVFHSIAWQYFTPDDQARGRTALEEAGEKATEDAPLAWLRMEADDIDHGAGLCLTTWPDGHTHDLARVDFHGRWVEWHGLD